MSQHAMILDSELYKQHYYYHAQTLSPYIETKASDIFIKMFVLK